MVTVVNIRGRMRNRVNVRRGVGNGVQVIAMPLVVDMRLRVGNVVSMRLRMEMAVGLIAGAVRLIGLNIAVLSHAVSIDHPSLLRIGLTLNHLSLNYWTGRAIALVVNRLVAVGRDVVVMRRRVWDAINVSRRVRYRIDMIAMLDVIGMCRRVRHIVVMRGGVWHDPLGLSGSRQSHDGNDC